MKIRTYIITILKVLISLSLSEGNFSDKKSKDNCLEKYNNLFKEIDCEMFLSTKDFLGEKFFA